MQKKDTKDVIERIQITTTKQEEIDEVIKGLNELADVMEVTLGTHGRTVLIQKRIKAFFTKDGFTVSRFAVTKDPKRNLGMAMLRDVSRNTNTQVGDGTTTVVLLARGIINAGLKKIREEGVNSILLAESIRHEAKAIQGRISALKRDIKSNEEIRHVAFVSSGNERVAGMITQIYEEKGRDSTIIVERSDDKDDHIELIDGLKINTTYAYPQFINSPQNRCIIEKAAVIVVNKSNIVTQQMIKAVENVVAESDNRNLIIFAKHITGELADWVMANNQAKKFSAVLMTIPDNIDDVALVTGAKMISDNATYSLANYQSHWAGYARRIVCNSKYSVIEPAENADIEARISTEVERLKELDEKKQITKQEKDRLSNLSGSISVLKIGNLTDIGWEELYYRVEDAIRATEVAVKHGIIAGEYFGLLQACEPISIQGPFETRTVDSFFRPIVEDMVRVLFRNSGEREELANVAIKEKQGYDFLKKEFVDDLYTAGIIDPAEVTQTTLRNATDMACTFLTLSGLIIDCEVVDIA
jgi:chaperonin GroEL